jgi:hypothetical protein
MDKLPTWQNRSIISANLLNPAFCGEVLRSAIMGYNFAGDENLDMPYTLTFLILPIVLHKRTREAMPINTRSYFHMWVESHEYLFIDFAERTRQLIPYCKEAILFLSSNNIITLNNIAFKTFEKRRTNSKQENAKELNDIYKKSELLGKWFRLTGNEQTIYMFLKIQP